MGRDRRRRATVTSARGVQVGDGGTQYNYFGAVTYSLFVGGFERLRDVYIDPVRLVRDLDLARFTGREALIGQIDGFVRDRSGGFVVVQAEAGIGKSCLAAYLAGTRPWFHHFTRLPGGRSPQAARKNLAAQLILRWGLHEWAPGAVLPATADDAGWFDRLLWAAAAARDAQEPGTPIVLVVDGLDEAEAGADIGADLPLGLPVSLPAGVFVVATSRFGIDRALHAVRNPADWRQIEVESADNLADMAAFLRDIASPESARRDPTLLAALGRHGVDADWFMRTLAGRCAGVWIYLRYVLDEVRDGTRDPREVDALPADLAGYYAGQVYRWRDGATDGGACEWERVRLPLLGVLAAAREPLTLTELIRAAGVSGEHQARVFVEETARAFLNRDTTAGQTRYGLRHQSLRDLLSGVQLDGRGDMSGLADLFAAQARVAHAAITAALAPPGEPGERVWQDSGRYAIRYLAGHAAACGRLDEFVCDPGFLLTVQPEGVLGNRDAVRTEQGRRALAAAELSLERWADLSQPERLQRLTANAARMNATGLLTSANIMLRPPWPIRWAAWAGHGHRIFTGHASSVTAVAVGRVAGRDIIVSGSSDQTVRMWDAVTGNLLHQPLTGHTDRVNAVAVGRAAGRDIIVSGDYDGTVRIWDAVTGDPLGRPVTGHTAGVSSVATGRAGGRDIIVTASWDLTVRTWDAVTGDPLGQPLTAHTGHKRPLAVATGTAADRDIIVTGGHDRTVRVWDAVTGHPLGQPLTGHTGWVNAVAVGRAADHDIIVSGGSDGTVRVWDAATGRPARDPLTGHTHRVCAVAVGRAADRDIIVSGSPDGTLQVWDAATGNPLGQPLTGHTHEVCAVAVGRAADRDIIVSGSSDRTLRVWDTTTWDGLGTPVTGHTGRVNAVAAGRAADREIVVSGGDDGMVRVWDAVTGNPLGRTLTGHTGRVNAVAVGRAADRDIVVSGGDDGMVRVWDAVTGNPLGRTLTGHTGRVNAVAVGRAADHDIIVSGGHDGTVRVWDAVTGNPLGQPLTDHIREVYAVAVGRAADHDIIVSGGHDGTVRVWDAVTGNPLGQPITARSGFVVSAVAVGRAADHDIIVSGGHDGTVQAWDAVTRNPLGQPLGGHTPSRVDTVAVGRAADHDIIVSAGSEQTVRVWDAVTGTPLGQPLTGHTDEVRAVAVGRAADHDIIISGGRDYTIIVRSSTPPPRPPRTARRSASKAGEIAVRPCM
jgi:WD40 repeat protein